jgi:hypothetical protein
VHEDYSIHRLNPDSEIPSELIASKFYSLTKTEDELSLVCDSKIRLPSLKEDKGWSCFQVSGPLELSLVGIIAELASLLAGGDINIFTLSTYDTDYILVRTKNLEKAKRVLKAANYQIV